MNMVPGRVLRMVCKGFKRFKAWQVGRMRNAIEETKWYASEEANRDIGFHAAEQLFLETDQARMARQWRTEYCGSLCEHREGCELAEALLDRIREEDG